MYFLCSNLIHGLTKNNNNYETVSYNGRNRNCSMYSNKQIHHADDGQFSNRIKKGGQNGLQ